MYNDNNKIKIIIAIKASSFIEVIDSFFFRIPFVLGATEYSEFYPSNPENLAPDVFIKNTPVDAIRSIFLIWNETGMELSFFRHAHEGITIYVQRFGDYLTTDYTETPNDLCDNEKILDIKRYLTMLLDLCENLIIEDIELIEDSKYHGPLQSPKPTPNTLAATYGPPIYDNVIDKRKYEDYFKIMIQNMKESASVIIYDPQEDMLGKTPLQRYQDLIALCSWHGYDIKLCFNSSYELVVTPINEIKTQILNDIKIVDAAFYTRFILLISKRLNIKDFETYFNRPEYIYHLEDYN